MSDSGQHPDEGGFGPPPGAGPWSQSGPAGPTGASGPFGAPTQPVPPVNAPQLPPPTGQPYGLPPAPASAPQQGYPPQVYAPAYQPGYPAYQQYQPSQQYQPGQPGSPGQPAYAGYAPAATSRFPVDTFILLVLSAISLIATGIIGIPSAIVAVIAWRRSAVDPARAKTLSTIGWIVYAVNFAIGVPLLIWFYVWALSNQ